MLALRAKCGIHIPDVNSEDWEVASRTSIDVRRGFVVEDGIREAKKKRFNTSNLLRVSLRKLLPYSAKFSRGLIFVDFVG